MTLCTQDWQFSLAPFHNQSREACWSLNSLQTAAQQAHSVLPLGLGLMRVAAGAPGTPRPVAAGAEKRPGQVAAVLEALIALVLVCSWSMLP